MQRRRYLYTVGAAGLSATGGCLGALGGATGTLATRVSDQPGDIGDFETCVVTIDAILVKPAESDGTETGTGEDAGVRTIDAGGATADLVQLQGEESTLVNESELDVGDYEWLKLGVSDVDATLEDGGEADVVTPGEAPLKFEKSFEIREGTTTSFTADFTPVAKGQSGGYVLQPVANEVEVTYEAYSGAE